MGRPTRLYSIGVAVRESSTSGVGQLGRTGATPAAVLPRKALMSVATGFRG